MKEVTTERRERRALRSLFHGELQRAETRARNLLGREPDNASGWAALRGALAAQGQPADAAALRRALAEVSPRTGDVIDRVAGRRLSARGLIFDPAERFRIRRMAQVLEEVPTPAALRSGENVLWYADRGGELFERFPVLELDGAGAPSYPVRYLTPPKFVAAYRNAAVVGEGQVLTEQGEFIDEVLQASPDKYQARRTGDELVFAPAENDRGQQETYSLGRSEIWSVAWKTRRSGPKPIASRMVSTCGKGFQRSRRGQSRPAAS